MRATQRLRKMMKAPGLILGGGAHDALSARIVEQVKALHPETPIIGFPKGAGEKLAVYARETGVDAVGIDETIDPRWAALAELTQDDQAGDPADKRSE